MNPSKNDRYRALFENRALVDALRSIGVHAIDFTSDRLIPSMLWESEGQDDPENIRNGSWLDLVHEEDRPVVESNIAQMMAGETNTYSITYRIVRTDGTFRWIRIDGALVRDEETDQPEIYFATETDVTEQKLIEERLRQQRSEEVQRREEMDTLRQAAAIFGSSLDPNETVHKILEQTHRVIPYDQATVQLLEGNQLNVLGVWKRDEPGDNEDILKMTFPYPETGSLSTVAIQELRPVLTNNVQRDFPAFVQPPGIPDEIRSWIGIPIVQRGIAIGLFAMDAYSIDFFTPHHLELAGIISDHISIALENARLHEKTYRMAMTDALTGIGSRHRFEIEGRLLFENAKRGNRIISAAMLDVDRFKKLNDTYGHDVGDTVLRKIAEVCKAELRTTDLLARYGGEEFVLLLPGTNEEEAYAAMERVRREVQALRFEQKEMRTSVSIGIISEVPGAARSLDQFIAKADEALYDSKTSGRNRTTRWRDETA